jgi:hypothetical protein
MKLISSKPLITIPFYKNYTDSKNILNPYEASLLMKRLVDQAAIYNKGIAPPEEGF